MTLILDGRPARDRIAVRLKRQIASAKLKPVLAIVQVGREPATDFFISRKKEFGEKIGAPVKHTRFPSEVKTATIKAHIQRLATDKGVHGIIVQLPLPDRLPSEAILESIPPTKDVDGLTAANLKHLWLNDGLGFVSATAKAVLHLLRYYRVPLAGRRAVVIGRSRLVGKPLALTLLNQNATVTVCHRRTRNLQAIAKQGEILIIAAGRPRLITPAYAHRRQVVVDVGTNLNRRGRLTGDVDFAKVAPRVRAISPVPGGVGPLTVASLFENLVLAWQKR